jgi:hypothetical protein
VCVAAGKSTCPDSGLRVSGKYFFAVKMETHLGFKPVEAEGASPRFVVQHPAAIAFPLGRERRLVVALT